jgi:DNA-directed RNA polymerase subunit RPC12/RpoP
MVSPIRNISDLNLKTRTCRRCSKVFRTFTKVPHAVCPECNTNGGRMVKVNKSTYDELNENVDLYSNQDKHLSRDGMIIRYMRFIKHFKLEKKLKRFIDNE